MVGRLSKLVCVWGWGGVCVVCGGGGFSLSEKRFTDMDREKDRKNLQESLSKTY